MKFDFDWPSQAFWPKMTWNDLKRYSRGQGYKSSGRAGRAGLSGPAQLQSQAVTARPAKILGRNGPGRAGPFMPNFISIRIFERFFKENLNFITKSFQIKHFYFKNGGISAKSSRNLGKKRPGPKKFWAWTARPGPAQLKFGPDRPGPAQST